MTKRAAFISTMQQILDEDESVVLLLGDISCFAFRESFAKHPTRCLNVGICEQASVSLAAGLAMSGLYPVYHTIDAFLARRAYEQLKLDFGEQNLPGMFVTVGGLKDYASLGPTHCCGETSMASFGVMLDFVVVSPKKDEIPDVLRDFIKKRLRSYIRLQESS